MPWRGRLPSVAERFVKGMPGLYYFPYEFWAIISFSIIRATSNHSRQD